MLTPIPWFSSKTTVCGTNVCYPGDVITNTASLELFKLVFNIIISQTVTKYVCFHIENVYLSITLGRPEYVKIQLSKISQEFIEEYNLTIFAHKGFVYFEIFCECYGLPQSGILANKKLRIRL